MASWERFGLWLLVAGPVIWAAHFLTSYIAAALHCARMPQADLGATRAFILVITVVALVAIGALALHALRAHRGSEDGLPHDEDHPQGRSAFLGFATLLLAGLSAVAIVFVALPAIFFEACW